MTKPPTIRNPFNLPNNPTKRQLLMCVQLATQMVDKATRAAEQSALTAKDAGDSVAVLMHRLGVEVLEISDEERRAAWDYSWLRVNFEVLEHDDGQGNSVRLRLMPVTAQERALDEDRASKDRYGPGGAGPS